MNCVARPCSKHIERHGTLRARALMAHRTRPTSNRRSCSCGEARLTRQLAKLPTCRNGIRAITTRATARQQVHSTKSKRACHGKCHNFRKESRPDDFTAPPSLEATSLCEPLKVKRALTPIRTDVSEQSITRSHGVVTPRRMSIIDCCLLPGARNGRSR